MPDSRPRATNTVLWTSRYTAQIIILVATITQEHPSVTQPRVEQERCPPPLALLFHPIGQVSNKSSCQLSRYRVAAIDARIVRQEQIILAFPYLGQVAGSDMTIKNSPRINLQARQSDTRELLLVSELLGMSQAFVAHRFEWWLTAKRMLAGLMV